MSYLSHSALYSIYLMVQVHPLPEHWSPEAVNMPTGDRLRQCILVSIVHLYKCMCAVFTLNNCIQALYLHL